MEFNPQYLVKSGINDDDILCHSLDSNNTKDDIKKFFFNPNGVLICQDECFIGMESHDIIYCVGDGNDYNNIRCHLMRATSDINIVYAYDKDENSHIVFSTSAIFPQFMQCDIFMKND